MPAPSKTDEREFAAAWLGMIEFMSRLYRNQVLLALNKGVVNKFADKQKGNYAVVLLNLSRGAERKLLKRFSNKRIERFVRDKLMRVNQRNANMLYGGLEKQMGINASELLASEGLQQNLNALIMETAQWAKKLRDETLELYVANTLRVMSQGGSLESLLSEFDGLEEKRKDHARFTARNQINNFNALVGKARVQNLGIEEAVWETAGDERVRPCHQARDGKTFKLSEGLYSSCDGKTLLPGIDYNCRCTSRYVIPDDI